MALHISEFTQLGRCTPPVLRLGLATRGNTHLTPDDVLYAIERGVNYLNWCAHPDGMSCAIRQLSSEQRQKVVVAVQFFARNAEAARRELDEKLRELGTDYVDVVTFYYVERESEWGEIAGEQGALEPVREAQTEGRVRLIGLTTHQRSLAAKRAKHQEVDLLMIRYNAAHRGAEREIFPTTDEVGIPIVAYTCLRWGALLRPTPEDSPGLSPPTAQDCYRFALSHPSVSVAIMAPNDRGELEANLSLLSDWRGMTPKEMEHIQAHGARVYRTAGGFP